MPRHVPDEKGLMVPDAESLDDFLASAKAVYCDAHGITVRTPGRPREEARIWKALEAVQDELIAVEERVVRTDAEETAAVERLRKIFGNDMRMIELVRKKLEQSGEKVLVDDTLKKYVKLARLKRRAVSSYTPQEEEWLAKNDRKRWKRHLLVVKLMVGKKLTKEENSQFKRFQDKRL